MRSLDTPLEPLDGQLANYTAETITVNAELIAADILPSLVEMTQSDYTERGLFIGRQAGKLIRSKVITGHAEGIDETTGETMPAGLFMPNLPFGLKSLLPSVQEVAAVHTHPITPELDHLKTTPITDKDIQALIHSRFTALVMADRGGIHLLGINRKDGLSDSLFGANIVDTAFENSEHSMDVIAKTARQLSWRGLSYFYTPDLVPKDGVVELRNMKHTGV